MTTTDIFNSLIAQGVPVTDAHTMVAIAQAESGLDPMEPGDGGTSIGLFQIHMPAWAAYLTKWTGSTNVFDWVTWLENSSNNVWAAAQVYKIQGLTAWTTYKTGAYLQFMGGSGQTEVNAGNLASTAQTDQSIVATPSSMSNIASIVVFAVLLLLSIFIVFYGVK